MNRNTKETALMVVRDRAKSFGAKAKQFGMKVAAGFSTALAAVNVAYAQTAPDLGAEATTQLTAAKATVAGILILLIGIVVGFAVYSLVKRAANKS